MVCTTVHGRARARFTQSRLTRVQIASGYAVWPSRYKTTSGADFTKGVRSACVSLNWTVRDLSLYTTWAADEMLLFDFFTPSSRAKILRKVAASLLLQLVRSIHHTHIPVYSLTKKTTPHVALFARTCLQKTKKSGTRRRSKRLKRSPTSTTWTDS